MVRWGSGEQQRIYPRARPGNVLVHAGMSRRFRRMPRAEPAPENIIHEKRAKEYLHNGFRLLAAGWTQDTERRLSAPAELFYSKSGPSRFYSEIACHGLEAFLSRLAAGALALPETPYGIVLHETDRAVSFVLIDTRRRLVIHERLLSYDPGMPQSDWSKVSGHIADALALASDEEARKSGQFAVYDGTLRLMAPENRS